ncbi:MAG: helix-turn-helix domain-containing protein [Phycisphaerales bacterium]|nr:helix-turn-helix domain-containing protein [Phycisphaerales bacterium]
MAVMPGDVHNVHNVHASTADRPEDLKPPPPAPSMGAGDSKPTAVPSDLITQEAAAEAINASSRTIRRYIRDGKLKGWGKVGARRVSRSEVEHKFKDRYLPRSVHQKPPRGGGQNEDTQQRTGRTRT